MNGSAAAQLRAVQSAMPAGAELVVSGGVVGRFTDRQAVYPVEPAPQNPIPVTARTVVFVLTDQGEEGLTPAGDAGGPCLSWPTSSAPPTLVHTGRGDRLRLAPAAGHAAPGPAHHQRGGASLARSAARMSAWHTTAGSASPRS